MGSEWDVTSAVAADGGVALQSPVTWRELGICRKDPVAFSSLVVLSAVVSTPAAGYPAKYPADTESKNPTPYKSEHSFHCIALAALHLVQHL